MTAIDTLLEWFIKATLAFLIHICPLLIANLYMNDTPWLV